MTQCLISKPKASRVVTVESTNPGFPPQHISILVSSPLLPLSTSNLGEFLTRASLGGLTSPQSAAVAVLKMVFVINLSSSSSEEEGGGGDDDDDNGDEEDDEEDGDEVVVVVVVEVGNWRM